VVACSLRLRILAKRAVRKLRENMGKRPILPALPAEVVDDRKLANLLNRRAVYGDICQSFEAEEIKSYLLQAHNDVPTVMLMMLVKIRDGERSRKFLPPSYFIFRDGEEESHFYKPPSHVYENEPVNEEEVVLTVP